MCVCVSEGGQMTSRFSYFFVKCFEIANLCFGFLLDP